MSVPRISDLYQGVRLELGLESSNRHLRNSILTNSGYAYLEVTLVEEEYDEDDEEEGDDFGDEIEEEDDDDYDDEDIEECPRFPKGCSSCQDYSCTGPDAFYDEEDSDVVTAFRIIAYSASGVHTELGEDSIVQDPALCRFLNQVNSYHDL